MTKKEWVLAGILAGLAHVAGAQQLEVKLTLAYTTFITGEPVVVQLDVLNATRDFVRVGEAGAADAVLVEVTRGGQYDELPQGRTDPIAGAFEIKPGQSFQRQVELDKWFQLADEGRYVARLIVVHDGMRYESARKSFDVVPGIRVKEGVQMFVSRAQQRRMFKLVHWNRNQTDRLFLRIEDEPGNKVWDTIDLGVVLRSADPKLDIAPNGEVTIVHRATQDAFIRTVVWSLPESVEVAERNQLLDPEVSATRRVRALYGDPQGEKKEEKKAWWKIW